MDKWQKKKTLRSNVARMNVSATHNRDRHCGRAPSPNCWQFSTVLLLKTSESLRCTLTFWRLAHSCTLLVTIQASITVPQFPCGAHSVWKTKQDFPSCITLNGEYACARFMLSTNDTIPKTSGARLVWSHWCTLLIKNHMKPSLGFTIHLLHQHRENTLSTCTLHTSRLAQPHRSICSNLAPTTLPNLLLTFSLLCTWTCWKPNTSCLATSSNTLHGSWWEPNLPTYNITASIWAEHNPNSTYPWCSSHTHLCWSNLSFLLLSCKNSQENMSASSCSSNVMFFHLLMLLCACTNLNVMIEILLKKFSVSKHLKQTALVWPPSNHGPPRREIV